jgi:Na+/melibiose symporter-like transporter
MPDSIPIALAASLVAAVVAAVAWALLTRITGLWLYFLAMLVAAAAGYALTLFTEKRNAALGLFAALVGLFGILTGKVCIAKWVMLPELQEAVSSVDWDTSTLTE